MATILHAFFMIFLTVNGITLGASKALTTSPDLSNISLPYIRCTCLPQVPIFVPCSSTESPAESTRKVSNAADNFGKPSESTDIPTSNTCKCPPPPLINRPCPPIYTPLTIPDYITPRVAYAPTPRIIETLQRAVKCPDGQMFDSTGVCRTPLK